MAQLSVTATLFDSVTQEQYNTLLSLVQGLLAQYGPMFSSIVENNIPPNAVQVPVLVKVSGTDPASAQSLVTQKVNTAFGIPPTAPVTEIDVGPAR